MRFTRFAMERWQSTYEHRVRYNLSESGVHPLSVQELLELAGVGDLRELAAIRLGYGQSNGSDPLRETIASLYPGAGPDHVVATVGGAEANLAATWRLVEPDEPVAVMLPNYMQIPGLVESLGGVVHPFRLVEDQAWQPDLDALRSGLEAGARCIVVTHPNNPTGATLTEDSMRGILDLAHRYGAWILADEVYRGAEVRGPETASFWGRHDRVIVTHSLSKAYGLPGLRVGWVVAPPEVAADLWARTDYTTIVPASLSDRLARVALEPGTRERVLARTRAIIRENLEVLTAWLDGQGGLFQYRRPDAGAICYVRYDAPVRSVDLAEKLRVEQEVLIVPGAHFGMDAFVRLGFGLPRNELETALDRLGEAFRQVVASV